jgi:hypothetical protein
VPFARYEVDFVKEHFAGVQPAERPTALAIYFSLVDVSARMLLDGRISGSTLHACADECGVEGSRRSDRYRVRSVAALVHIGLLSPDGSGGYFLTKWHDHHRSRAEVRADRDAAAERKRRSRVQSPLPGFGATSHRDVTPGHSPEQERDSRAHARPGAVTETEELQQAGRQTSEVDGPAGLPGIEEDPEPELDIDPVDERLGHVASSVEDELTRLRRATA